MFRTANPARTRKVPYRDARGREQTAVHCTDSPAQICRDALRIGCTLRGSSQRLVERLGWCHPAKGLSRSTVELGGNGVEIGLGMQGEVTALGEVLA
jgi:hypothetical protein